MKAVFIDRSFQISFLKNTAVTGWSTNPLPKTVIKTLFPLDLVMTYRGRSTGAWLLLPPPSLTHSIPGGPEWLLSRVNLREGTEAPFLSFLHADHAVWSVVYPAAGAFP